VNVPAWLRSPRALFALVAFSCAAALAAALVSQHVFDMQPCPWCILQRLIFVVIGVVALVFALAGGRRAWRAGAALMGLFGVAGIAAASWHHLVAASSASCDLTLADRIISGTGLDMAWPEVFAAFASCAEARVDLFGMPYEFWSLLLYVLITAAAVWVWRVAGRCRQAPA
jgi:disulfide bond formation protein DsbB